MMMLATWSKRTSALAISKSGEAIRGGYNTAKAAFHLELIRKVMRKKLLLFLAVLFCVSGMSVPVVNAQVNVSIGFLIVLTTSMALGIGTDGLITLGRQGTGDGVITTDIGTTATTGIITDGGGKLRNVSLHVAAHTTP